MRKTVLTGLVVCGLTVVSAPAEGQGDALTVHGYLTQAWAISDGGQFLGIPERGTTSYRTAALQFRYSLSPDDHVVVQLSHRRLGEAQLMSIEPDVRFDWVFYERRVEDLRVKVGRVPIPAGIYNELRDVGALLPFYRAPFAFYFEGANTSETVDGIVAHYLFQGDTPWSVDLSGFFGGWDLIEQSAGVAGLLPPTPPALARAENGAGGELWINTPLLGLRAGVGGSRYDIEGGLLRAPGDDNTWKEWHVSLDGSFERFTVQGEYRRIQITDDAAYIGYYGHVGINLHDQFSIHGLADYSDLKLTGTTPLDLDFGEDLAVGARVLPWPDLVLKAEFHFNEGYRAEEPTPLAALGEPPARVNYFIFSVSKSF